MFAGLNTFRHMMISALNLENFEFSEVYLFFWDKLERSNSYINWFIEHPQYKPNSRAFEYMLAEYLSDGGWWNTFANLVNKYGLVPKDAMKETFQSGDSEDMNATIKERLDACVNHICRRRRRGAKKPELHAIRRETMVQIHNILTKFLGEPPKTFNWAFGRDEEEDESSIISHLNPHMFKEMIAPGIDLHDFVPLAHVPTRDLEFGKLYRIRWTGNVSGARDCTLLNVDTDDLARYAKKSILAGMAVWFVADVSKHFNYLHSALDDELDDSELVFGRPHKFQKGDRITFRNVQGNHAMALTGVNVDEHGVPTSWQVENSWGYWDHETPGLDGFLTMSASWFKKYVVEIVVHRKFLSRTLQKMLTQDPVQLNPWDCMAPATRAGNVDAPQGYNTLHPRRR
jgi:bleomycin hydrolase